MLIVTLRSLEAFLSFRFASPKLSTQDFLTYQLHNTLVLDEVEVRFISRLTGSLIVSP